MTDSPAAGVAAPRDRARGGWTRYGGAPYHSIRDKTRDTVVRKVAQNGGFNMAIARHEALPYLSAITYHCKPCEPAVVMAACYEFDESHVSFVTGSGETANKVQSIVEDAGELRKELVEEHAAGAFIGMEGVFVDDDAVTDDDGDGAGDVLGRDADTNAGESTESDDSDIATDDGQFGFDDFF